MRVRLYSTLLLGEVLHVACEYKILPKNKNESSGDLNADGVLKRLQLRKDDITKLLAYILTRYACRQR